MHIQLHTVLSLFLLTIVYPYACILSPLLACLFVYSLYVFSAYNHQYICIVYDKPIDWCSINCSHASIHAHTPHHVHKSLYTLMFFFYNKLVVDMCSYTLAIACMYSLHACPFIHSMFSVHACSCFYSMFSVHTITNIRASSTTTDRLMFHELFPCKYSCAYSSSCAQIIVHYNVFLLWRTCSTYEHL